VSYRDQYTLGGLALYAAIVPAVVFALRAPVVTLAFAAGALTALAVGRVRAGDDGSAAANEDARASARTRSVER